MPKPRRVVDPARRTSGSVLARAAGPVLLGFAASVFAQHLPLPGQWPAAKTIGSADRTVRVTQARIVLDPVRVEDLTGGPDTLPQPTALLATHAQGGALVADGALRVPAVAPVIRRRLPGVWQIAVDDWRRAAGIQPRIEVESRSGRAGMLSLQSAPSHGIGVRAVASSPRVVAREGDSAVLRGDVDLHIDTASLRSAGVYEGRLVVILEGF